MTSQMAAPQNAKLPASVGKIHQPGGKRDSETESTAMARYPLTQLSNTLPAVN
jgi:hypothetical protein